mmetsp:Transcript_39232/g.117984  ORF Transcript_39232/g.117984 Transcript_39232/m.117984 type:complete len:93 (+) Transcript_39232:157-435(+)
MRKKLYWISKKFHCQNENNKMKLTKECSYYVVSCFISEVIKLTLYLPSVLKIKEFIDSAEESMEYFKGANDNIIGISLSVLDNAGIMKRIES